jgi:putative colanic acid biosynthesis acetyltransferase WcaF
MQVDLSTYNNNWYKPGNAVKRFLWHYTNLVFFKSGWFPVYGLKVFLLKLFGAVVGKNVCIKPSVNIKYPWFLHMGNNVWIGEDVWIDNLTDVHIGDNVCISQGALLITGSHNYSEANFGLLMKPIHIENGVWICAKAVICGGVVCGDHSIITAGAVATKNCEPSGMYRGNPAELFNKRSIV